LEFPSNREETDDENQGIPYHYPGRVHTIMIYLLSTEITVEQYEKLGVVFLAFLHFALIVEALRLV
jgi:hypothetical protein